MTQIISTDTLQPLLTEAKTTGLGLADLTEICTRLSLTPHEVLNALSLHIAEGFLSGLLTYEGAMATVQGLETAIADLGMYDHLPQPAFALSRAFDEGSWARGSDARRTLTASRVSSILQTIKP